MAIDHRAPARVHLEPCGSATASGSGCSVIPAAPSLTLPLTRTPSSPRAVSAYKIRGPEAWGSALDPGRITAAAQGWTTSISGEAVQSGQRGKSGWAASTTTELGRQRHRGQQGPAGAPATSSAEGMGQTLTGGDGGQESQQEHRSGTEGGEEGVRK